ncbi:MAG: hypothetical protein PHR87_08605 [Sulfurospirillaceae bacterium]|nr:hypothetical protein [Sulfurospirillaceae bacterium]
MSQKPEIIVIDDNTNIYDPLIIELGIVYEEKNIKLFQDSLKGLDYILANLSKKMIVILDIKFTNPKDRGDIILEAIRKQNKLIPVIIWSAEETQDFFKSLINNHALYFVEQTDNTEEILKRVEGAIHYLNVDVATAIETWLDEQDNKEQILSISNGKEYSTNDLISEIRKQSEEGRKIEKEILELTIDLLFRKKESI